MDKEYENDLDGCGNLICSWCDEVIMEGQPVSLSDDELMHIGCAAEEQDNIYFDSDMEFGS